MSVKIVRSPMPEREEVGNETLRFLVDTLYAATEAGLDGLSALFGGPHA